MKPNYIFNSLFCFLSLLINFTFGLGVGTIVLKRDKLYVSKIENETFFSKDWEGEGFVKADATAIKNPWYTQKIKPNVEFFMSTTKEATMSTTLRHFDHNVLIIKFSSIFAKSWPTIRPRSITNENLESMISQLDNNENIEQIIDEVEHQTVLEPEQLVEIRQAENKQNRNALKNDALLTSSLSESKLGDDSESNSRIKRFLHIKPRRKRQFQISQKGQDNLNIDAEAKPIIKNISPDVLHKNPLEKHSSPTEKKINPLKQIYLIQEVPANIGVFSNNKQTAKLKGQASPTGSKEPSVVNDTQFNINSAILSSKISQQIKDSAADTIIKKDTKSAPKNISPTLNFQSIPKDERSEDVNDFSDGSNNKVIYIKPGSEDLSPDIISFEMDGVTTMKSIEESEINLKNNLNPTLVEASVIPSSNVHLLDPSGGGEILNGGQIRLALTQGAIIHNGDLYDNKHDMESPLDELEVAPLMETDLDEKEQKIPYKTWKASLDKSSRPPGFYVLVDDQVIFDNWEGVWQRENVLGRWIPKSPDKIWNETELLIRWDGISQRDVKISLEWEPVDDKTFFLLKDVMVSTFGTNVTHCNTPNAHQDSNNKNVTLYIVVQQSMQQHNVTDLIQNDTSTTYVSLKIPTKPSATPTKESLSQIDKNLKNLIFPYTGRQKETTEELWKLEEFQQNTANYYYGITVIILVALVSLIVIITIIRKKCLKRKRRMT